jgi:endoglucanase
MRCLRKQAYLLVIILLSLAPSLAGGQTRFVATRGKDLVSPKGKPLLLKGINLGNWLLPEGYMFKFKATNSPRLIQTAISELVGEDEARRFWKTYRDNYITQISAS